MEKFVPFIVGIFLIFIIEETVIVLFSNLRTLKARACHQCRFRPIPSGHGYQGQQES